MQPQPLQPTDLAAVRMALVAARSAYVERDGYGLETSPEYWQRTFELLYGRQPISDQDALWDGLFAIAFPVLRELQRSKTGIALEREEFLHDRYLAANAAKRPFYELAQYSMIHHAAVVAIGRNEGERLRACLASARREVECVVYVDSGSTDGSIETARELSCHLVKLDTSRPFTAARARNLGAERAQEIDPGLQFIQFVDGDCELVPGWMRMAVEELLQDTALAVVCGRRRERNREATRFNRLCDIEWDSPLGDVPSCGGDAMIRVSALREVGGYNGEVIAGEEPELCVRLRKQGWKIRRIEPDMAIHDASMRHFSQWWRRAVRSGHAYAQGYAMHGAFPELHCARQCASNMIWGLVLPVLAIGMIWPTHWISLSLLLTYPVLWWKLARSKARAGLCHADARLYATHVLIGKFAELLGMAEYWRRRLTGEKMQIIDYKSVNAGPVRST